MAASSSQHSRKERIATFVFGTGFLITLLVLSLFFPEPKPFQYLVFRAILALAAAGFAAFIPGFIHVEIKPAIRAGGALAVFVVVYFFSPATMVSRRPEGQSHKDRTSIAGIVVDQATNQGIGQATIVVAGRAEEYVTEDSGNFRIDFRSDVPSRVRLHVNKDGFHPLDTTIEPPAENLVLQLRKQ